MSDDAVTRRRFLRARGFAGVSLGLAGCESLTWSASPSSAAAAPGPTPSPLPPATSQRPSAPAPQSLSPGPCPIRTPTHNPSAPAATVARYGADEAMRLALEAGDDLLLFANQQRYDETIFARTVGTIDNAVVGGRIDPARISHSAARLASLFQSG